MTTVTLSTGYKFIIPKIIRDKFNLKEGQIFQIIPFGDRLELVLLKNIKELRGSLKGIDTNIEREGDRI
jgi:AbrB family looped-hinge helix DNA binding protein